MSAFYPLLTLFLLTFPEADEVQQLARRVSVLMTKKGTEFPYSATYGTTVRGGPGVAVEKRSLFFFSDSKASTYSTESTPHNTSRMLLRNGVLQWEYSDEAAGTVYFQGKVPHPAHDDTEAILTKSYSALHTYTLLDKSLAVQAEMILKSDARQLSTTKTADGIECLAKLKRIKLFVKDSGFEIADVPNDPKTSEPMKVERFTYIADVPKSVPAEIQKFEARFDDAAKDRRVTVVEPEFKFNRAFELLNEAQRAQSIEPDKPREAAARLGYRLPTGKGVTVKTARGTVNKFPSRHLVLELEFGNSEYAIAEYIPPFSREHLPDGFVRGERKIDGYAVLHIADPGTGAKWLYYIAKDISFIVECSNFRNDALDSLIITFRQPTVEK